MLSGWPGKLKLAQPLFLRRGQGFGRLLLLGGLLLLLTWQLGPTLWQFARDQQRLTALLVQLGWFGPIALVALNALQIIIAPIPGYVVQLVAGFLYGAWWGGLWGACGQMIGSTVAMWLARTYGRPLVERLVGGERLARWDAVTLSHHMLFWFVLLATPTGDLPYYLAGLAGVSYVKIGLITLSIRVPTIFVVAAVGAGAMWLPWWQLTLIFLGLGGLLALFLRYQERLIGWFDRQTVQVIRHSKFEEHL
jgi:uncharacterized membrane protein YdjX (TVP38/TMEM64 family)